MLPRDEDLSETNFKDSGKLMMYLPENEIDFFVKYPAIPMHFWLFICNWIKYIVGSSPKLLTFQDLGHEMGLFGRVFYDIRL